jgi:hypothetical protein
MESIQKDTRELEIRSPEWDKSFHPITAIKKGEAVISVFFKLRSLIQSVEANPPEAKDDIVSLTKTFAWEMANSDSKPESIT